MKRLLLALAAGAAAGWIARELTRRDPEDNYEIQDRELEPGVVIISAPLPSEAIALDLAAWITEQTGHEFRVGVCRMPEPETATPPSDGGVWH